ncbi:MAG TPA: GNAT family N-acetyltransferase [Acidimicrobiia bacterium]
MERAEVDRLAHLNLAAFCAEAARFAVGGAAHDEGGVLVWRTNTRWPVMTNGMIRLDDGIAGEAAVDRAREYFADCGFTAFTRDVETDADLAQALAATGWPRVVDMPEMVCSGPVDELPVPADTTIRRVTDTDGVRDFAEMSSQAYATIGMPPDDTIAAFSDAARALEPHLYAVVAYVDGVPVSGALANLSHGIAGVYWVGTVAAARGRRLADVCTRAVTNWAFDRGARAVSLQASSQGEPIYRAMGYEERFRYYGFVSNL